MGVMCLDKEGYVITPEEMCVIIFVFELDKREVLTIARDAGETPLQEGEKPRPLKNTERKGICTATLNIQR